MKQSRNEVMEVLLAILLFGVVSLTSAAVQQRTMMNRGLGVDGCSYYSVAEQILQRTKPQGPKPFVFRIGTPFLASLLGPHDLLRGFLIANIIAAGLLAALMVVWLRLYIGNWKLRLLLLALFLCEWSGPTRVVYFYPDTSHPWPMVFCLAGLICINKLRSRLSSGLLLLLCLICFVGLLFREFVGLVGVAVILTQNPLCYERRLLRIRGPAVSLLLPLGCAFLGWAVAHYLVTPGLLPHPISGCQRTYNPSYSFIYEAGHWMYTQPLAMYLEGWLIAFGPILFLLIFGWREVGRFLKEHQSEMAFLAGVVGLGWIGGGDTEAFAFWAMPVIYVLCGKVIEQESVVLRSVSLIAFLASMQAISERLFWTIPDFWGARMPDSWVYTFPPEPSRFFLVPFGNVYFQNLLSHWGRNMSISFVQYCFVGFILLVWLFYRRASLCQSSDPKAAEKWRWI